ncbi:hypothetical protein PR003_g255 [Phytophthora rubi]|uniref:DUF3752 domain-containing protein n=1 Tax=Phytophthora rubi TaxID=129364 RepID=A0A6A3PJG6_9STRA|nr:hypothetical protein PR002_g477 [Phytophthora rubi]KAE9052793.1 hypothetical protein PR001_g156 [Phytophthora rubi]KAE9360302.1 hypothetical protein PR003_g255 [Phytophthora rubi]
MGKHERDRDRESRSSRLDDRHKRHKRRHDDEKKKKKHKKHKDKERKRHKSSRRSDSDSDSDSDAPTPDYERATAVVRELLTETPELAKDLLGLLQMMDDGEVAVIGGIENRRIRSKLKELFPLLGLVKLREPKGAFAKSRKAQNNGGESLMEILQRMLSGGNDNNVQSIETAERKDDLSTEEAKPAAPKPVKRELPIGPALPPPSAKISRSNFQDDDDDEEVVGPALPGMKGFRLADERVEAEMARKAQELEKEQWERARDGGSSKKAEMARIAPMVREAWMTMMPESSILKDSLGPQNRPPPGKPAAFRSKEPAAVDKTWFDSPEERERAKRAKLDMELLGYVREENAPSAATASSVTSSTAQPAVNESILPNANPEADEEMRKQMDSLRKARGPSLLEQHQRKQAEQAKTGAKSTQSSGGWKRDRDLTARRGMSGDDAERMISAAKQINSKFTAPAISRQFL